MKCVNELALLYRYIHYPSKYLGPVNGFKILRNTALQHTAMQENEDKHSMAGRGSEYAVTVFERS
jgi:hypothetical protein